MNVPNKKPYISLVTLPRYPRANLVTLSYFAKDLMKRALGRTRGPDQVISSLCRGLTELGISFNINPRKKDLAEIVHVICDERALRQCIALKRQGLIKKLIAGPSITITPFEGNKIYLESEIDKIVFPSDWPRNFFLSLTPELAPKIEVWPAGSIVPEKFRDRPSTPIENGTNTANVHCLLYIKNSPEEITVKVRKTLAERQIKCTEFVYGTFKQQTYFDALLDADFVIFLSPTESQGIALQEAWFRNIPTFVWNPGIWHYKEYSWSDPKISAPYLEPEVGLFFTSADDANEQLESFLAAMREQKFKPRDYALRHFTDKKCALRLIEIIDTIKKP